MNFKTITFAAAIFTLAGCATYNQGDTVEQYASRCKAAQWRQPTIIPVTDSASVGRCANEFVLIQRGVIAAPLSEDEAFSMAEDAKCKAMGAAPGSDTYVECRLGLAQIRATAKAADQQASQQAFQNLLLLNSTQQRQPKNCTAYTAGPHTSINCN